MAKQTKQRKETKDRRNEILSTTLDLVTENGIDRLRAADIAEALGVSTALIFYHFKTLENVIVSAFELAAENDLANLDTVLESTDGTIEDRLRAVLNEYGPTGRAVGWRLWIETWSACLREPALRDVTHRLDMRWREVVTDLIRAGVDNGEFRTDDPQGTTWRLTAMLDGLAVQLVALDGAVSKDDVATWMDRAIRSELQL
ncbi:AcrR family transcriptional regulator [Rhodococcus sp. PvR044]|uniref:TetR/AcrR family transcriptional regulator n=1 Tax=Rhodococcus TaxID=1827 RepID=UPI000BD22C63|nr:MULTISPECIES: TetR family transcriptional regulator C-terminal domain-containing protein [Rhodococcus]MBP1159915.1 AcrR family transcriptional regulator [Rhodococcus sp. PvR099]MCZ4556939.1 TetR family transcriptional regulator C-terminal domain-containing protein [Rhodococcus maanshanensis]PTR41128.1 TetR family transcriptional regulator [Rhodococcus sp. OK611]SNX91950.1 transcriptional regulator, TetR family [Rhodococcus sp. OK270]